MRLRLALISRVKRWWSDRFGVVAPRRLATLTLTRGVRLRRLVWRWLRCCWVNRVGRLIGLNRLALRLFWARRLGRLGVVGALVC